MDGSFDTNIPIDSSATVHEIVVTFDIISCDGPCFFICLWLEVVPVCVLNFPVMEGRYGFKARTAVKLQSNLMVEAMPWVLLSWSTPSV